eukprot:352053_1
MTYKPHGYDCEEDGECDEGLYCESGTCSSCLYSQISPDKSFSRKLKNWATCKYGENNCPDVCAMNKGDKCGGKDDPSCCRGMKCSKEECIKDKCGKTGNCTDDDDICPKYGCLNGSVVYAEG